MGWDYCDSGAINGWPDQGANQLPDNLHECQWEDDPGGVYRNLECHVKYNRHVSNNVSVWDDIQHYLAERCWRYDLAHARDIGYVCSSKVSPRCKNLAVSRSRATIFCAPQKWWPADLVGHRQLYLHSDCTVSSNRLGYLSTFLYRKWKTHQIVRSITQPNLTG